MQRNLQTRLPDSGDRRRIRKHYAEVERLPMVLGNQPAQRQVQLTRWQLDIKPRSR
jgi:hypothetical protein